MTMPFEISRLNSASKRSRRRSQPETPAKDLETILIEKIDEVNYRAARREANARREQDELIRLLRWSIRMVEVAKTRGAAVQSAPQAAALLAGEMDDADEYR